MYQSTVFSISRKNILLLFIIFASFQILFSQNNPDPIPKLLSKQEVKNKLIASDSLWDDRFFYGPNGYGINGSVQAMVRYGNYIYVGGDFTTVYNGAEPLTVNNIARWDMTTMSWSELTDGEYIGLPGEVEALAVDASGVLYIGGRFWDANGNPNSDLIIRWNGSWSSLGGGLRMNGTNSNVSAIVIDEGYSPPRVYAGGFFVSPGSNSSKSFAWFDGVSWNAPDPEYIIGVIGEIRTLALGANHKIYAGGNFIEAFWGDTNRIITNGIACFDPITTSWSNLAGDSILVNVYKLKYDPSNTILYALSVSSNSTDVKRWNGSEWSDIGITNIGIHGDFDFDNSGNLYISGNYSSSGTQGCGIYKWNGSSWKIFDALMDGNVLSILCISDDELYIGGGFHNISSIPSQGIGHFGRILKTFEGTITHQDGITGIAGCLVYMENYNGTAWVSCSVSDPTTVTGAYSVSYDAPGSKDNYQYRIYVAATNYSAAPLYYSPPAAVGNQRWVQNFKVSLLPPVLKSPLSSFSTITLLQPTLRWYANPEANKYHLQIFKNSTNILQYETDITLSIDSVYFHTVPEPLAVSTGYRWQVSATNNYGDNSGYQAAPFLFTTGTRSINLPEIPILNSPLTIAVNQSLTPTLFWQPSSGETPETYTIDYWEDGSPAHVTYTTANSVTSYQIPATLKQMTKYHWRVMANNLTGSSSYSADETFITLLLPPNLTSTSGTADGTYNLPLTAIPVNWTASGTAPDAYDLEVATLPSFGTSVVYSKTNISAPHSIIPIAPLFINGTTYYWRVKAKKISNPIEESEWSPIWRFTTMLDVVTLLEPVNNKQVSITPTLIWSPLNGAEKYDVEVFLDSGFTGSPAASASNITTPFWVVNSSLSSGNKYYWRVLGKDAGGNTAGWSSASSPDPCFIPRSNIPSLLLPENYKINIPQNITLSWSNTNALSYILQYSTDPLFVSNTQITGITGTTHVINNLNKSSIYFWRVQAVYQTGNSEWSGIYSFTTILDSPSLLSPTNGFIVSKSPVLTWQGVNYASGYELQVSPEPVPGFNPKDLGNVTTCSVNNLQDKTTYIWSVRAKNSGGYSSWSPSWGFSTSSMVPNLIYPSDGMAGVLMSTEFSWNEVSGATKYIIQVSTEGDFITRPMFYEGESIAPKITVSGMDRKTLHFWRVGAVINGTTIWSATWSFKTAGALIAFDMTMVKYDSTVIGNVTKKLLTILNNGASDLVLPRIIITGAGSVNFSSPDINSSITIPPGGSRTITLHFSPVNVGNINANLEIYHNDISAENNPVVIPLSGIGVRTMCHLVVRNTLDFGSKYILTEPVELSILITNNSNVEGDNLILKSAQFESPTRVFEVVDRFPIIIRPGLSFNLRIIFNPVINGIQNTNLLILNSSNNPEVVTLVLGSVSEGKIVIKPISIDFKNTSIAQPYKDSIIEIKNNGLTPQAIISKTIKGDTDAFVFIKNENNVLLPSGKADTVIVRFSPRSMTGRKNGKVEIITSELDLPVRNVSLTGIPGDNPVIIINQMHIDCGVVSKSCKKDTNIIIKNDGSLDLNIDGYKFNGPDAGLFAISGNMPKVIKSGEAIAVKICITGKIPVGYKTAELEIRSNDPNNPLVKIIFTVMVNTPLFWKSADKIIWDTALVSSCVDSSFVVGNAGNINLLIKSMTIEGPNTSDFSFSGIYTPYVLKPDSIKKINIMFCPNNPGIKYANIFITTDDPGMLETRVVLRGNSMYFRPEILTDTLIDFGKIAAKDSAKKEITLKNNSKFIQITIDSISLLNSSGNYFNYYSKQTPFIIGKNQSYTFQLKFEGFSTSQKYPSGSLLIYYNNSINPLRVRLIGTMSMPRTTFKLIPVLEFGKVLIDSLSIVSFEIMNIGDANLIITSASVSGADSAEFKMQSEFPVVISPDQEKTFYVSFKPARIGPKEARIILIWNDLYSAGIIKLLAEGVIKGAGTLAIKNREIPKEYGLSQNYPNPFNPNTRIEYALPKESKIMIKVYNNLGQEIETLINSTQPAGNYIIEWNPHYLSSGVYYYRIQADKFLMMKKMMYIR